jgi:glyoxylase-like metal-dependent hydrolase (beta-lactamase superfamily II)
MKPIKVRPHLYWISLPQDMEGYDHFIGSWVYTGRWNFIVDVGPRSSLEALLAGLRALGIARPDFVFLTHVHIDHAGALGAFLTSFPQTKVICHASGVKHLVDPGMLWEGSLKVLGDLALKFGEIDPAPERNLVPLEEFNVEGFRLLATPGHAVHHISLIYEDYLFAGEAGGVFRDLGDANYLRPPTPPRFILEEAVGSIDKLLETEAQEICYAHAGIHPDAKKMLRTYRDQLFLWEEVIRRQMKKSSDENLMEDCIRALLREDPLFRNVERMAEGDRKRERSSTENSIRGYIGYLRGREGR